ncbi:MAG: aminodeoxychorismate synthase component I [Rhodospirillales bacterium]|nr:aminodeoxychorismate synthase component I [Rhodospirillales bacterium]
MYPAIEELRYRRDAGAVFAAFADRPWSMFLDSGADTGRRSRYDIVAADPYLTLTTRGPRTEIQTRGSIVTSEECPFALLKRALGEVRPSAPGPPFAGGAMGYFAYDLARRLEQLPVVAASDLDLPDLAVGLYDWALVVDHAEQRSFLVSSERGGRSPDRLREIRAALEHPVSEPGGFAVASPVHFNMTRREYERAFDRIKRYIREGDCYQVNFAQRFSARIEGRPWQAYRALQRLNPAPFSAYLRLPDLVVLSSSPERFLQVRDGLIETRPVKGTRARSPAKLRDRALAEELRASAKDRAENLMIVDLLRNDLGKNSALGSIAVPALFELESFATVHHLVSTVTGRLAPGRHALDLLAGCFPGGSITGAPKLRAMEIIEELEPHRRNVYCGAIGYIGFDGAMDTSIAIRTLLIRDGCIFGWAGGGIVSDSDPHAEYQETWDKAEAMLRLLTAVPATHVGG